MRKRPARCTAAPRLRCFPKGVGVPRHIYPWGQSAPGERLLVVWSEPLSPRLVAPVRGRSPCRVPPPARAAHPGRFDATGRRQRRHWRGQRNLNPGQRNRAHGLRGRRHSGRRDRRRATELSGVVAAAESLRRGFGHRAGQARAQEQGDELTRPHRREPTLVDWSRARSVVAGDIARFERVSTVAPATDRSEEKIADPRLTASAARRKARGRRPRRSTRPRAGRARALRRRRSLRRAPRSTPWE